MRLPPVRLHPLSLSAVRDGDWRQALSAARMAWPARTWVGAATSTALHVPGRGGVPGTRAGPAALAFKQRSASRHHDTLRSVGDEVRTALGSRRLGTVAPVRWLESGSRRIAWPLPRVVVRGPHAVRVYLDGMSRQAALPARHAVQHEDADSHARLQAAATTTHASRRRSSTPVVVAVIDRRLPGSLTLRCPLVTVWRRVRAGPRCCSMLLQLVSADSSSSARPINARDSFPLMAEAASRSNALAYTATSRD